VTLRTATIPVGHGEGMRRMMEKGGWWRNHLEALNPKGFGHLAK
jgi:hypothetical protein